MRSRGVPQPTRFHHREPVARSLLADLELLFRERVCGPGWRLAFVTGSGSLGLEILAHGCGESAVVTKGEYSRRLTAMLVGKRQYRESSSARWAVQYETAESRWSDTSWCEAELWDCVSSLPFYSVPPGAAGFVTVSSKQVGAEPIVSIVGVREEATWADCDCSTYLCLGRWLRATEHRSFPHTPALSALWDLRDQLKSLSVAALRAQVVERRAMLHDAAPGLATIGDGPVVTYESLPDSLVDGWSLYRTKSGHPQVFLWSGMNYEYDAFAEALRRVET